MVCEYFGECQNCNYSPYMMQRGFLGWNPWNTLQIHFCFSFSAILILFSLLWLANSSHKLGRFWKWLTGSLSLVKSESVFFNSVSLNSISVSIIDDTCSIPFMILTEVSDIEPDDCIDKTTCKLSSKKSETYQV